jgi:hypothetical protein
MEFPCEFFWQLRRVCGVILCEVDACCLRTLQKLQFLWSSDDQPEHLGIRIVEYLAPHFWTHPHTAILWHGQRLIAHAQTPRAFQNEIKLLRANMLVQGVGALGRHAPNPRAEILTAGPLQKISIRNFHQVRWPPRELIRSNEGVCRLLSRLP